MSETRNRSIGKKMKVLKGIQSDWKKQNEKLRCDCLHTRKGELDIKPSTRRRGEGQLCYVCRQCEKELSLNMVPQKTTVKMNPQNPNDYKVIVGYEDAVAQLDSMCDIIKMSLNVEREKDAKIATRISEAQYRIRNNIIPLYQASLNKTKQNGQGGNNPRSKNVRDQSWGKAEVSQ